MNNGDNPYTQTTATATDDNSNSFEHTLYFTAQGSDGATYTSNYSTADPSVPTSVLNLDKMTKDAQGYYHFNGVVEITAKNDVKSLGYWLTMPSSSSSDTTPNVQLSGSLTFEGTDATSVEAATQYSNKADAGKYLSAADYKAKYGDPMPDLYYVKLAGSLTAGQKLKVTFPFVLKNADKLDLTQASSAVNLSEAVNGNIGLLPWGLYTTKDVTTASLSFAKTDSTPLSTEWKLFSLYKSDYEGKTTNSVDYKFSVNNKISTATSLDYTYTGVPQISNDIIGLDSSDLSYKNSNESTYTSLPEMFENGKVAYARGGYYQLKLAKIKQAYDGTGWSTNGMYNTVYTYTTSGRGLIVKGLNDNGEARTNWINVELWHYVATTERLCLTVGDTFTDDMGIAWVRPYNKDEVRNPLNDPAQAKLIDVTYADADGNAVDKVDTSKPGKYTVTYRYYNADSNGNRTADSASAKTTVYVYATKAASCPAEETATISYDNNGGEGSIDQQQVTYTAEKAGTAVLSDGKAFTRSGYTFKGWNTKANGTGTAYAASATMDSVTGDVTLYAQWEKQPVNTDTSASDNKSTETPSKTSTKASAKTPNSLAKTGSSIAGIAIAAVSIIAAAVALVAYRRRRNI